MPRRSGFLVVTAFLLLITAGVALAQSKTIPVLLVTTTGDNDQVGQQLVFEIKEAIRGSHGFRLIDDYKNWPYIKTHIVTIRSNLGTESFTTAVAYAFIYDSANVLSPGVFINQSVAICGRNVVRDCARQFLSHLDSAVSELQSLNPDLAKTLK
jgi:hypothetical protein